MKNYRLHQSPWPPQGPGKNHADAKNRPLWPKGKKVAGNFNYRGDFTLKCKLVEEVAGLVGSPLQAVTSVSEQKYTCQQ